MRFKVNIDLPSRDDLIKGLTFDDRDYREQKAAAEEELSAAKERKDLKAIRRAEDRLVAVRAIKQQAAERIGVEALKRHKELLQAAADKVTPILEELKALDEFFASHVARETAHEQSAGVMGLPRRTDLPDVVWPDCWETTGALSAANGARNHLDGLLQGARKELAANPPAPAQPYEGRSYHPAPAPVADWAGYRPPRKSFWDRT